MAINYVKFQRGSLAAYIALKDAGRLDKNTLYFIKTEDGINRLYMGENLISGSDVVLQSAKLDDLEDVIASGANTNSFLVFNGEKWVAKTLSEVVELVVGDIESVKFNENQFAMDNAGLVNLLGYAEAEIGSQPVKNADGTIGWVKPKEISTEDLATVEQLNNLRELVENNANDIDDLQTANNNFSEIIDGKANANEVNEALNLKANITDVNNALEGKANISDVNTALELKANVADVYSKEDADQAIASAIAGVSHLKRKIFDSKIAAENAMIDYGDSADQYIYMVHRELLIKDGNYYDEYMAFKKSDGWTLEKIGDWEVDLSAYAKTEDVNEALDLKANKTDVESALSLKSNIIDVTNWLNNKVDKIDGHSLMSDAEHSKLEGIESGAQVNIINSINTEELAIDENKQLSIKQIAISKVVNLEETLNAHLTNINELEDRVEAIEGMLTWTEMIG